MWGGVIGSSIALLAAVLLLFECPVCQASGPRLAPWLNGAAIAGQTAHVALLLLKRAEPGPSALNLARLISLALVMPLPVPFLLGAAWQTQPCPLCYVYWIATMVSFVEMNTRSAIATLGVAALAGSAVGSGLRLSQTEPTSANNLRQLAVGLNLYMAENDGGVPYPGWIFHEQQRGRPYVRCPLSPPNETYVDDISTFRMLRAGRQSPTALDPPLDRRFPAFDIQRDVLFRCREHGYDGYRKLPGGLIKNYGDPGSTGRTLAVRLDTSVRKLPYVSCWELGTHDPKVFLFAPALIRSCDRPLNTGD